MSTIDNSLSLSPAHGHRHLGQSIPARSTKSRRSFLTVRYQVAPFRVFREFVFTKNQLFKADQSDNVWTLLSMMQKLKE